LVARKQAAARLKLDRNAVCQLGGHDSGHCRIEVALVRPVRGVVRPEDATVCLRRAGDVDVDEAIDEIALITGPHKAIDWLSTFPHVVAIALGGDVDEGPETAPTERAYDAEPEPPEPDDAPPFKLLRFHR